jgi:hypothetical protein
VKIATSKRSLLRHEGVAGAEAAAGAGEDRHLEAVALAELGPGLGQAAAHLVAQRVEPLRPVHPHHQDLPVFLGLDDGHLFVSQL